MLFRVEMKLSNQAVPAMVDVVVVPAVMPRRADWTCIAVPVLLPVRVSRRVPSTGRRQRRRPSPGPSRPGPCARRRRGSARGRSWWPNAVAVHDDPQLSAGAPVPTRWYCTAKACPVVVRPSKTVTQAVALAPVGQGVGVERELGAVGRLVERRVVGDVGRGVAGPPPSPRAPRCRRRTGCRLPSCRPPHLIRADQLDSVGVERVAEDRVGADDLDGRRGRRCSSCRPRPARAG